MLAVGQPRLWLIDVPVSPIDEASDSMEGLPYFSRIPRVIRLSEFHIINESAFFRFVVAVVA